MRRADAVVKAFADHAFFDGIHFGAGGMIRMVAGVMDDMELSEAAACFPRRMRK